MALAPQTALKPNVAWGIHCETTQFYLRKTAINRRPANHGSPGLLPVLVSRFKRLYRHTAQHIAVWLNLFGFGL